MAAPTRNGETPPKQLIPTAVIKQTKQRILRDVRFWLLLFSLSLLIWTMQEYPPGV